MPDIENAKIESTMLGIEDHGIMTFYVFLAGDGWGCGFGGYALDTHNRNTKTRKGSALCCEAIRKILETVGVSKWEDLKGKLVRVENTGVGRQIKKIGNIIEDSWFDIECFMKQQGNEE